MKDLVYPELSYKIVGLLFDVHNKVGGGHREGYYYKSIKILFNKGKIPFKEQLKVPLNFENQEIGHYFLDFLVEDKIVLEIKAGERFRKMDIQQVYDYLKTTKLKLGILVNFTKSGVKYMRVLNIR